jgi:hypothetical protein
MGGQLDGAVYIFLLGSVTSTVFDMLPGHIELLKIIYRNPRPCPFLFHSCTQVPSL